MKPIPYLRWSLWAGLLLLGSGAIFWGYRQGLPDGIPAMDLPPPLSMRAVYQEAFSQDTFCTPQADFQPSGGFDPARFLAPLPQDRPWLEWYWPGIALSDLKLTAGLQAIYEGGWGGIALQPTTVGLPNDSLLLPGHPYLGYDQPSFYRQVQLLLKLAHRRGLQVDLPLGDGAPSGGVHLGPDDHPQSLVVGEAFLYGGKSIDLPLPAPGQSVSQALAGLSEDRMLQGRRSLMDPLPAGPEPVAVLAAKVARDHRSARIWCLTDSMVLRPDSLLDLSAQVDSQQCLHWEAPPGSWLILAFYAQPSGQRPAGSAQPGPGLVVDPLDSLSLLGHAYFLTRPATGLTGAQLPGLRGWSYQAGPWRNSRWFHPALLAAFEAQHGYSLVAHLPALMVPGADDEPLRGLGMRRRPAFIQANTDAGVRWDYAQTLGQRLQQAGIEPLSRWMNRRSWALRSRVDGCYDPIGLAGQLSLPEASQAFGGGSVMALKLAVSGASLYGRPLVSCRAFGQEGMAFRQAPQQMKINLDHLLVTGFNHLVYAGMPAQPPGQPHWHPLAAPQPFSRGAGSDFSRDQPFAAVMPQLNRYVARCQYVLRQGRPQREVLVYFPWQRFPPAFGRDTVHQEWLFRGEIPGQLVAPSPLPPALPEGRPGEAPAIGWLRTLWPMLQELENQGISWDWANDAVLQQAREEAGRILAGEQSYQLLLLPELASMPLPTAQQVVSLAEAGLPVLRVGTGLPTKVPGFDPAGEAGQRVEELMTLLTGPQVLETPVSLANHLVGYPPRQPIRYAGRYPFLRQTRRVDQAGNTWMFLVNRDAETRFFDLTVDDAFSAFYWLDPWQGKLMEAAPDQQNRLRGRLPAFGSMVLLASKGARLPDSLLSQPVPTLAETDPAAVINYQPLQHWDLLVEGPDVPGKTLLLRDTSLFVWTDFAPLRYVASEGLYTHSFFFGDTTLPHRRYVLDLGSIHGLAEVTLNTQPVGTLLSPPYQIDLTEQLSPGFNTLEIWLTPPRRNRLVGWGREGRPGFAHFATGQQGLTPNGLLGPVVLWELKTESASPLLP